MADRGLGDGAPQDEALVEDLLALLQAQRMDFTASLRALSDAAREDERPLRALAAEPPALDSWIGRWRAELASAGVDPEAAAEAMEKVNPVYVPRNHLVEDALAAATAGDLAPFERLVDVLAAPFEARPGLELYAAPAPPDFGAYQTFCGT